MADKPLKFGSKRCWQEWTPPAVLYEGQVVRVFRWQAGFDDRDARFPDLPPVSNPFGHWEEGVLQEVFVDLSSDTNRHLRVAAVDLRDWWRTHLKSMKSGRPPVGIRMRANTYWLKQYRVEACDPKGPQDWPIDPPVHTGPSIFDFARIKP